MASKKNLNKTFSLAQQKAALSYAYKDSSCKIKNNQLTWAGVIRPTPLSKEYRTLLVYKIGESPKIWVIGDELEKLEDKDFPHNYHKDIDNKMVRICLYRYSEFNAQKIIADTIIPWTIEWLYFYELWLATGVWLGGGDHPQQGEEKKD